jgi:1,4-dihydroxy-2-naphthoyl-CoA synthase
MLLAGPDFRRWLAQRPTPRPAPTTPPVHVVRTDGRLEITLSRPEVHNAYSGDPTTAHLVRTSRSPARLLAQLSERVVAHVHGACVGAGAELAAFAHRVVAHPGTWFQLPEITMGLVPGAGGTASLSRRIGRHRTASLALTGDRIDARRALAWGLVDEVTD